MLQMCDPRAALPLFEEAAVGFQAQLGAAHPRTQTSVQNMTICREQAAALVPSQQTPGLQTHEILYRDDSAWQTAASAAEAAAEAAQPAANATTEGVTVVVLKGLVGAVQHNGKRATVLGFDAGHGRFELQLQADATQLRAKPGNIEVVAVPVGLKVVVGGLVGATEHNGKRGAVIDGPDAKTGRYKVQLDDADGVGGGRAKLLGLKPANLRLLPGPSCPAEPAAACRPPAAAGPLAG